METVKANKLILAGDNVHSLYCDLIEETGESFSTLTLRDTLVIGATLSTYSDNPLIQAADLMLKVDEMVSGILQNHTTDIDI